MKFSSGLDRNKAIPYVLVYLMILIMQVLYVSQGNIKTRIFPAVLITLFFGWFIYLCLFQYHYRIDQRYLRVCLGPFLIKKVALINIVCVSKRWKRGNIYGLSRDYLVLELKSEESLVISPKDKQEFVSFLSQHDIEESNKP